jgi:hypothetical protein
MATADSTLFSTVNPPTPIAPCGANPCVAARQEDDAFISRVSDRTKRLIGEDIDTTGPHPGDFGPEVRPDNWTYCQNRAADMGPFVRQYLKYRDALTYARAANDVNKTGDDPSSPTPKTANCLTRLPDTAPELNKALGIPKDLPQNVFGPAPPPLTDADLRNDDTGFRAAMYRDESTGQLILVPRDTEPQSLEDWRANTDNGQGKKDPDQYREMRNLCAKLDMSRVDFDIAGYSKGGGLAQEGGLISPDSYVYVFNSAGLPDASLARTSQASFDSLSSRTEAFNAQGDFMTYMNDTTDPNQQIANARYLRSQLEGAQHWYQYDPVAISYRNPATLAAQQQQQIAQLQIKAFFESGMEPPPDLLAQASTKPDPTFQTDKQTYLKQLDGMIEDAQAKRDTGQPFRLFPPVRTDDAEVIPGSLNQDWSSSPVQALISRVGRLFGAGDNSANFGKLVQHRISGVVSSMQDLENRDKAAMKQFLDQCG